VANIESVVSVKVHVHVAAERGTISSHLKCQEMIWQNVHGVSPKAASESPKAVAGLWCVFWHKSRL
jgi:hypothetical protein